MQYLPEVLSLTLVVTLITAWTFTRVATLNKSLLLALIGGRRAHK